MRHVALVGAMLWAGAASAASLQNQETFGAWSYGVHVDAMSREKMFLAYTKSKSGGRKVTFIIKCDPGRSKVYPDYNLGTHIGTRGEHPVRYRVDDGPVVEENWQMGGNSFFNIDEGQSDAMVDRLLTGTTLVIEGFDYFFKQRQSTFSLDGASIALMKVREGCAGN